MPSTVKLVCGNPAHATKSHTAKLPLVAQFRHDDEGGWGRVRGVGEFDLLWEPSDSHPDGEIRVKHHATCPKCGRGYEFREDRLYPLLEWALANGKDIPVR